MSDTPRTDSEMPKVAYAGDGSGCPIDSFDACAIHIEDWREMETLARQLERALTASRAECEALRKQLTIAVDTLLVYASNNPHGPKAAQDCLIALSIDAALREGK